MTQDVDYDFCPEVGRRVPLVFDTEAVKPKDSPNERIQPIAKAPLVPRSAFASADA